MGQDVGLIAQRVDYIAPMLYPSHWVRGEYGVADPNRQPYDIVKATLADFQAKTEGTGVALVPWIQDFSLGHPYGPDEVRAQIDAARDLGIAAHDEERKRLGLRAVWLRTNGTQVLVTLVTSRVSVNDGGNGAAVKKL